MCVCVFLKRDRTAFPSRKLESEKEGKLHYPVDNLLFFATRIYSVCEERVCLPGYNNKVFRFIERKAKKKQFTDY